jgi:adenylate kinase family enzyme
VKGEPEMSEAKKIEPIDELVKVLRKKKVKTIYLVHYPEELEQARAFKAFLQNLRFKVTLAHDARRLGKAFVSKKIAETDISVVLNPQLDVSEYMKSKDAVIIGD